MYNPKERISASEINKFSYCQYSWYYERLYGNKYIREKHKERNELLGLDDKTMSNFAKGTHFHDMYLIKRNIIFIAKLILFIIIIVLAILVFSKL